MMPPLLCRLLLLGFCFGIATHAWAQAPKVMARASLQSTEAVVAGQQVRLTIDALTTTWFTKAPVYPDIKVPNAIVTPLDERSQNFNETIDDEKWFGVSHTYVITPTGDGDVTIPPLELTLYPGQSDGPVKATTQPTTLKVKPLARSAGSENRLVSTDVQLKQTLDRNVEDLKVGDAITRTIEIQAVGAQGMRIPPVTFPAIKGLAIYPKPGSVDDHIKDREGVFGSTRTDAATYVVQTAGKYLLPEVTVEWWNPASGKSETTSIPALEFKAATNPNYNTEFSLPQETATKINRFLNWHFIGLLVSAALLLSLLIYLLVQYLPRVLSHLRALYRARQERYAASEPAAFKRFEKAVASGNAAQIYSTLLSWVEHPDRPENQRSLDTLCKNNPALAIHINALRTALFDTSTESKAVTNNQALQWQGSSLTLAVAQLRQTQQPVQLSGTRLQLLNPV